MKFILASNNKGKLKEMRAILGEMGYEVISQSEAGFNDEVDETGETFEENAYLKAKAVADFAGLPAVADDSGIAVDALGGAPGVHSARYTGNHTDSDEDRNVLLLKNMENASDRSCRFVSAVCCVFPNGDSITTRGECEGTLLREPVGENGFGYDPLFRPVGYDRSMAQLSPEEKNAISHRGRALVKFKTELVAYLGSKE